MTEKSKNQNWTEIISPKTRLLDLHLREVWRYRELAVLFVKRDFAAQYKQTILGPLWNIIQPLLTTIMFMIVFNRIAKLPTDDLPAVLFYMCSITIWNYFSACLTATSNTFISNAGIFGKVYFPRLILPLSTVLSNMIKFCIQFGLLIVTIIYYNVTGSYSFQFGWHLALIPVIVGIMGCLGLGLGIIISSLTTKYRDFTVLIQFGVGLLMYVTPVVYSMSYLAESKYKLFVSLNPLSSLVETFRYAILDTGIFDVGFFLYSIGFTLVSLFVGIIVFNKVERSFMDTV